MRAHKLSLIAAMLFQQAQSVMASICLDASPMISLEAGISNLSAMFVLCPRIMSSAVLIMTVGNLALLHLCPGSVRRRCSSMILCTCQSGSHSDQWNVITASWQPLRFRKRLQMEKQTLSGSFDTASTRQLALIPAQAMFWHGHFLPPCDDQRWWIELKNGN